MAVSDCHILQVKKNDIANGPGIRVSVWVAGCSHRCEGCHNPETWKWTQGKSLTSERIEKILFLCDKPYIHGLTLTGGDPLFIKNRDGMTELCKKFREKFKNTKTIWLWTGYLFKDVRELEIFSYIDTVVEGKFIKELKDISLVYCGSSNQKVINLNNVN